MQPEAQLKYGFDARKLQDLKENLLNVKVSLCRRMGWKIFQGVLQHAEPKDDQ